MMSGDNGAPEYIPAVVSALNAHDNLSVLAVGKEDILQPLLADQPHFKSGRITIVPATEVVEMDDAPQSALRNKKDSSMRVAINCVKEGQADAAMSAGNTGALLATAKFVLKTLPGIMRPAICTSIPSLRERGYVHLLDLGANVDVTPEHLYQFAVMGSLLSSVVSGDPAPKVSLMNIGTEAMKGNELVRGTVPLMEGSNLNYIGFTEPDGIFFDDVDVIVSDGFTGNIALKTLEGTVKMIVQQLGNSFKKNLLTKCAAVVSMPVLKDLKNSMDPRKHNGASLLGLRGIVVKSHGNADRISFQNAIEISVKLVEQQIIDKMRKQFETAENQQSNE
ncbi:phosphate acyltransferase PlsX [Ignatzschineria cameli]|uniref:Phosphate acyltransferase n=2 Tax=Ignatzschineria cameli TaxID=2182793 RepID=A0A2U2ARA0_9GAMM|nr:phosphate acyltransferase PlsX [Ignatzschineria cameli]PWD86417.1 phosphate acyltransferase PlsX [Ignatzschineria cameli]PWD86795.1 phosphate acyltransferase PlsX [Ignatzschineria cameli]PWD88408.1 phosphate acyltransferase PlsX [Ignatzschineria cameli]PWD88770.1 phosphate acyltransferase PlsX [Ignatzschineria cameli]